MTLLKELIFHIQKNHLFKKDDTLLLAVSGGIDSMVMLHVLHAAGYSISIAHYNFNLRGEDSENDELFVKNKCAELKLAFHSTKTDTKKYAEENKLSIQMAARKLRYDWFEELYQLQNYTWLCTAHHADDNAETILLNLIKGTGLAGLSGIPERNGNIVRPLLTFSRKQIEEYARENNIEWRTDSSNESIDYQRNLVRHKVIPVLKQINPSLENTLTQSGTIMRENLRLVEERIEDLLSGLSEVNDTGTILNTQSIYDHPSLNSILYHYLRSFEFHPEIIPQITESVRRKNSGKQFYSKNFRVISDRERIIITSLQQMEEIPELIIEAGLTVLTLPGGLLRMQLLTASPDLMIKNNDPGKAYLDARNIKFPLRCRKWIKGDYFYPLGMEHRQKLSDYFVDHKVPISEKEISWVLMNGEEIAWVIGHRVDQRYRITDSTEEVLFLEWKTDGTANAL